MNIAVFYYDGFAEFEIVFPCLFLQDNGMKFIAMENREYRSAEGQRYLVDQCIDDVDPDWIELLIIPGGSPGPLFENMKLKAFLEKLDRSGRKIAGICGGSELLAALGLLKGRRCTGNTSGISPEDGTYKYYSGSTIVDKHVVVDGNIITGQGQAYAEFAVELLRQIGRIKDQAGYDEELRWIKNER